MQFETDFYATSGRATVFVIETEQVVRSALHYILRDRYRPITFAAVADALASAETPDAVLLGAAILQGEGDVLTELGEHFTSARILLVADRSADPLARAGLARGAHGIISKPISFDTVCDAVGTALSAPIVPGEPSPLIRVAFG